MDSAPENIYTAIEYFKKFPFNSRAREFWKLFKVRGSLENRHIPFYLCQHCSNRVFNDKEKIKYEVNSEGKFTNCHIYFKLCEDCIERNIFEVNNYIYKYSLKRKTNLQNTVSINPDETDQKNQASSQISLSKQSKKKCTTPVTK